MFDIELKERKIEVSIYESEQNVRDTETTQKNSLAETLS
jgi:hypothetical protein